MARQASRRQRRRRALEQRLRVRDLAGLRELAASDPNLTSGLVGLLGERDELLRWRAIEALGEICAERARRGGGARGGARARAASALVDERRVRAHAAFARAQLGGPVAAGEVPALPLYDFVSGELR